MKYKIGTAYQLKEFESIKYIYRWFIFCFLFPVRLASPTKNAVYVAKRIHNPGHRALTSHAGWRKLLTVV